MDFRNFISSLIIVIPLTGHAESLKDISDKWNKDLPEKFDSITKLQKTTTENNNFIHHFIVDANQFEFDTALPKVKQQIMSSICSKPREKHLLNVQKANLVYRYESIRGLSLGEFMVRPEHCSRN